MSKRPITRLSLGILGLLAWTASGCSSPETPPAASASGSPSQAPAASGPLAPARQLMDQKQYGDAAKWLSNWLSAHPDDGVARVLLENATVDQGGKPVVRLGFLVAGDTLKGREELKAACVAEHDVNAGGGIGGGVLNLEVPDAPNPADLPADVAAMVADDQGAVIGFNSGIPLISLLPHDVLKTHSFTPSGDQQWEVTTASIKGKGAVLVLMERGTAPPANVGWNTKDLTNDMRPVGDPVDGKAFVAVVIATPWSLAPAALATLTHAPPAATWICDLLGQRTTSRPSQPSAPSSASPAAAPPPGWPEGVLVASEFGADKSDPGQGKFTKAYMDAYDHKHPGPWGWRAWQAVMALRDCAAKGTSRDAVRSGINAMVFPSEPAHWYVLRYTKGDWQYLRTLPGGKKS